MTIIKNEEKILENFLIFALLVGLSGLICGDQFSSWTHFTRVLALVLALQLLSRLQRDLTVERNPRLYWVYMGELVELFVGLILLASSVFFSKY